MTKQNNQGKGKMGASAASSSLKAECFQLAPEGRVLTHEEARLDSLLQTGGAHGVEGDLQLREHALHPRAWRLHERHQPQGQRPKFEQVDAMDAHPPPLPDAPGSRSRDSILKILFGTFGTFG